MLRRGPSRLLIGASGPPVAAAGLLDDVAGLLPAVATVSIPADIAVRLRATAVVDFTDWGMRWTEHAPATCPAEPAVEVLGGADEDAVNRLAGRGLPGRGGPAR